MASLAEENSALRDRVAQLEAENLALRSKLATLSPNSNTAAEADVTVSETPAPEWINAPVSREELARYSRQMLVPGFGAPSQVKLRSARVLVIGAGGLGCPVVMLLAAAGVGHITVVDDDTVDTSNLHRQIGHMSASQGLPKVQSLVATATGINPHVQVKGVQQRFTAENAAALAAQCDVIVDASDNPATRYLVSDAAVLAGVPLVFGAALGMNGQLSVYNHQGGPCYRCLYPDPPPSGSVQSCADNGVLGPVPVAIGALQALECIKVLTGMGQPLSQRLLTMDAEGMRWRTIKLRSKSSTCAACGDSPTITTMAQSQELLSACGLVPTEGAGAPGARTDPPSIEHIDAAAFVAELRSVSSNGAPKPYVLDVRSAEQAGMVGPNEHSAELLAIPLSRLQWRPEAMAAVKEWAKGVQGGGSVRVLCRRGVDSVTATALLASEGVPASNVKGGLQAMARADTSVPTY